MKIYAPNGYIFIEAEGFNTKHLMYDVKKKKKKKKKHKIIVKKKKKKKRNVSGATDEFF